MADLLGGRGWGSAEARAAGAGGVQALASAVTYARVLQGEVIKRRYSSLLRKGQNGVLGRSPRAMPIGTATNCSDELGHQAANDVQAGRFARERARETIKMLETQVAFETLRSPADGTAYLLPVRPGSRVETGGLLAAVGDLRRMQVRAFVDEPELAAIETSQPVRVR